jgi:hypothetical protein
MPNPKKKMRKPNSGDHIRHLNQKLAIIKKIALQCAEQLDALSQFVNDRTEYSVAFEKGTMRIFAKPEPVYVGKIDVATSLEEQKEIQGEEARLAQSST